MKTCLIIGAAPCAEPGYLKQLQKKSDLVICADGGLDTAAKAGITPDLWVGDGDSLLGENACLEKQILPKEKDDTDLYYAASCAIEKGCKMIYIGAATGGRGDHFLANLLLLEHLFDQGIFAEVVDEQNRYVFHTGGKMVFSRDLAYPYVSLIPLDSVLSGVTIQGAKYPLKEARLTRNHIISVSNEPLDETFYIEIGAGRALVVFSRDVKK